ncbi:MAG: peroxiredoxin-like family protein, partial [Bacteroidota bacterium]
AKRESAAINIPTEKYSVMQASTHELKVAKLSEGAYRTGDTIKAFELPNATGETVKSSALLKDGPIVISFYRGGWCPYCNMELRALQSVLDQVSDLGASLVAISPETPDNSLTTSEKNDLTFNVLSDIDNAYAKELGLVFKMPKNLQDVYHSFNLDVPKHNGNEDYELPMPATYVVNQNGEIVYDFVPEDYTERLDPEVVIDVLNKELDRV